MEIGDKVLCISKFVDAMNPIYGHYKFPSVGQVYTVRGYRDLEGIYLSEIINKDLGFFEPGFMRYKFIKWNPEELEKEFLEKQLVEK